MGNSRIGRRAALWTVGVGLAAGSLGAGSLTALAGEPAGAAAIAEFARLARTLRRRDYKTGFSCVR